MQVVLVMFRSDGERRSFSVVRNMTIIGRREDCDLRIPVGDVSRKHCRLVRTDDGIRIEDLGSSNGTYVNGTRIQESEIAAGDVIGVGPVQFTVQIDGVPDEAEMSAPAPAAAHADDEDEAPLEEVPMEELPDDELTTEEAPLEELPADELTLDEAPLAASGDLEELPAEDEFQLEEDPAPTAPEAEALELEELPTAESPAAEPEPAIDLDDEFELEELPAAESPAAPAAEAPVEPVEEELTLEEAEPAVPPQPKAADTGDDLEELTLDELPEEEGSTVGELELVEESPAPAPPIPPAPLSLASEPAEHSLDELEFDDEIVELDDAAPTNGQAVKTQPLVGEDPLDLAPSAPAYADVKIDSADEPLEELELDDELSPQGKTAESAGESSWDFVIEESDSTRSHHDFKLDLDSPREQPHGQA